MIITEHLKENFFDEINGKHLLVIAANGVDSVCSFKIIKHILKNYGSPFSYDVITTKSELKTVFTKYGQVENLLLINYGATIDIIEFLEIDEESNMVIYILDSQRPIHINNFYNNKQVKLLAFDENFDNVPDIDDVFRDTDDESEDEELPTKRPRHTKQYLDKKIKFREWKMRREDLMAIYEDYIYHGTASSLVAYEIAASVNQYNNELLWTAAIGHTSQFILNFISRKKYCDYLESLKNNLTRVTLSRTYTKTKNREELFIEEKEELNLWLYRHWSLDESLHMTPVTFATFKLSRLNGLKTLNNFLAFLGIPLDDCKNPYPAMKPNIKTSLFPLFKEHCDKFRLSREELFLPTFVGHCGYRTSLSAVDATFIIVGILEDINSKDDYTEKFTRAMHVISVWDNNEIEWGLDLAKDYLKAVNKQTKDLIESNAVCFNESFFYVELNKAAPALLHRSLVQYTLARYFVSAYVTDKPKLGKKGSTERFPLILCSVNEEDMLTMYGIPPRASDPGKNLFGRVFDTILTSLNYQMIQDSLDVCRITVSASDKKKIFDRINRLLMS